MTVYHGSIVEIKSPDLNHSKRFLDFGPAFYVTTLRFGGVDEAWLDFVCDCRDGNDVYSSYDVIIGRVADDDVFRTIQSYRQGDITKARAIELLRFARPNDQLALRTEGIIAAKLRFVKSYQIASGA